MTIGRGVRKIRRALISVYNKDGLEEMVRLLHGEGVELLSTGGTQMFVERLGIPCQKVEDITSYPSILGGRVKTLHPKIFGGILGRRKLREDVMEMRSYGIPEIDLVVVDLYPFEETVNSGASREEIIEKIDIGGVSLIRAAAKNYSDVVVIPSRRYYGQFVEMLKKQGARSYNYQRMLFAQYAFNETNNYDNRIYMWFSLLYDHKVEQI